ncbi:hypothetical protein [Gordonia sp. (in: high G+C Gram-positive bacteria)]|uniref:hypothetical protein n=1 Tax=Gordonia sp. (in: high G+C Gram-positive bacteria) TaxID=84139 RepID=UPI003C74BE27
MSNLMVTRTGGRRPAPSDASPEIPEGQPTWCLRITASAGATLPGARRGDGTRVPLPIGVPIRLRHVGHDADGRQVWEVPAAAWWPGDVLRVGPVPDDIAIHLAAHSVPTFTDSTLKEEIPA